MSTNPQTNCPRCQTPLSEPNDSNVFPHCPGCLGVLIPARDVQAVLLESAVAVNVTADAPASNPLVCPSCNETMLELLLGDVQIDRCSACAAVWLDGGEKLEYVEPQAAAANLSRYLLYSLTLPERAVRSTVGLAAGAVHESAGYLVPQCFKSSTTYRIVVENSLKFLTEDIAGVSSSDGGEPAAEDFLARKAVGNFVDLAGLTTLHVSPLWMLAIISDVAYGSKSYVLELAAELQREGLIAENSTINNVDDVLAAIQSASGETATLFDTPPLSVEQLRETLDNTRKAIGSTDYRGILPEAELRAYWNEMREISARENVSLLGVSGALTMHALGKVTNVSRGALTGVRVAGGLLNRHIVGHYFDSLKTIREQGFYETVRQSAAPYIEAVWANFADGRTTWTEELVTGRVAGKAYRSLRDWFRKGSANPKESNEPASAAPPSDESLQPPASEGT